MSRYLQWICLSLILLASPYIARAQEPPEEDIRFSAVTTNAPALAPTPNDSRFVADQGGDLDQYLFRSDRPEGIKFNIALTRYYFNPQNPPKFDPQGFIQPTDLADLYQRHVLPPSVTLRLHAFDVDGAALHCPEVDYLYINNIRISANNNPVTLSGVNGNWSTVSFAIPTGILKFPQAKGSANQPPSAVDNEIKLDSDWLCENKWAVQIAWASLEIPSPMRPIVFAHGWTGDVSTFKEYIEFAKSDRLPTADPPDLLRGVKPIAETAPILAQAISQARREFGVDKVNVFAHSKGGLVTRHVLRNLDMAQQVDYLVTFGSPHHGSDLIPTWFSCNVLHSDLKGDCQKASDELSVAAIRDSFNYRDCQYKLFPYPRWAACQPRFVEQNRVHYISIVGGTLDVGERTATFPWLADKAPYPDNGQVEAKFFWRTHVDIHKNRQTYECAISFVDPTIYQRNGCLDETNANAADMAQTPQWPDESAQAGRVITGLLTSKQTIVIPITETNTIWVNLFTQNPLDELRLLDPNGQPVLNEATRQQNESSGWWYQYRLDTPQDGLWQLDVSSSTETNYQLQTFLQSDIQLFLTTAQNRYPPHTLITVTAALFQQTQPIKNIPITLTVTHPDDSQTVLVMNETNGLFMAEFDSTLIAGRHKLVAVAANGLVERQATTFIEVTDSTAQIEGVTNEVAQDENENGLYDSVTFNVALQVNQPGHYEISGMLVNEQGEPVASANYNAPLTAGVHEIPLAFSSQVMTEAYSLRYVSVQRDNVSVDEATDLYTSQSYAPDQLEGDFITFISASDTPTTPNDLGQPSQLGVTLTFTLLTAGDYLITGRLVDSMGQEMLWSQNQFSISEATTQAVTLAFEGAAIQQHGLAGPYRVQDVTVVNQSDQRNVVLGWVYTTTAYPLETFGASTTKDYLSGQVRLQGRTSYYGTQVLLSVEACNVSADPKTSLLRLTDSLGNYDLPIDPETHYGCLRVSKTGYLTATQARAQAVSGGDVREVMLLAGDVNHDQRIDIFDLAYVSSHYNKVDPTADVNGDGKVNIFDMSLVAANYQQRGPKSW